MSVANIFLLVCTGGKKERKKIPIILVSRSLGFKHSIVQVRGGSIMFSWK
jgi:hypothetical protein